jgi:uncharacterized membrane protein
MLSLEPEIAKLRDEGAIDPAAAERLIAIERREIFSIHGELRLLAWAGVSLLVAGVGLMLRQNLHRLGPVTILLLIASAGAVCYAFVVRRRIKNPSRTPTLVDDSALLLGALLLSAAIGYGEFAFHFFHERWSWHLLLIAVLHGAAAYWFASRVLLSLSITSLAAFFAINYDIIQTNLYLAYDLAVRGYIVTALLIGWRFANERFTARREFTIVFDHAIAIASLVSSLVLVFDDESRIAGLILLVIAAALVFRHGWKTKSQSLIIYAVIALLFGIGNGVTEIVRSPAVVLLYILISTVAAIVFLFRVRSRFREKA